MGVALSPYGVWSDDSDDPALNTSGINFRYGATVGTTHFVVDTSRNGQGPWQPDAVYPSPEDWCNPPDRGVGMRPTRDTGNELVDAFLWIKIPGESDGLCHRGTGGPEDPARDMIDPAAGQWFPEMALELVHNAHPAP
jgi:endoglucanase